MSCAQWYDIPPSLHRVLVYGKEGHTLAVKITSGRRLKMSDLFHGMMDICDPIVVAMSPQPKAMPEKRLPPDMAELLLTSEFDPSPNSSEPEDGFSLVYGQEEETSDFNVSLCNDVDMSPDTE